MKKPIIRPFANEVIFHRARGLSGPYFAPLDDDRARSLRTQGNFLGIGGGAASPLDWITANHADNQAASDTVAYVQDGTAWSSFTGATANFDVPDINGVENQGCRVEDPSTFVLCYADAYGVKFTTGKTANIPRTYVWVVPKDTGIFGCEVSFTSSYRSMIKIDGDTGAAVPITTYFDVGWDSINYAVYDFVTHWIVAIEVNHSSVNSTSVRQRFLPAPDDNVADGGYANSVTGSTTLHYMWQNNTTISALDFSGGELVASGSN